MPPRTRKPTPTVEVDPTDLTTVLYALASYAPATFHPRVAAAAVRLEAAAGDAAGRAGIFDIGWGLRAGDES